MYGGHLTAVYMFNLNYCLLSLTGVMVKKYPHLRNRYSICSPLMMQSFIHYINSSCNGQTKARTLGLIQVLNLKDIS